jgi:hypothetical protein
MPDYETSTERYRRLAEESLDAAKSFPRGEQRDALLDMAQVWQRLADQYEDATPPFSRSGTAGEQPTLQQQQQIQPHDHKK